MVFEKIKTKYVKEKIKGRSFYDGSFRHYIEDLKLIEYFIAEGPKHFVEGLHFHALKQKFKEDYEAIKDELKHGWREIEARRLAREKKKEEQEQKKYMTVRKKEERQWKKEWLSKGGKP